MGLGKEREREGIRAGEVVQKLKMLATLAKGWGTALSILMRWLCFNQ